MKYFCLLCLFITSLTLSAQDRLTGSIYATRSEVIAQQGMAATSQPLATQVALDILKKGGHAVDAAIAANATLGLMEPTGNGMGGDLFAIVWDAEEEKLFGLNSSGRSPYDFTLDYFVQSGYAKIPALGALHVSVPGCVDGWQELHDKWGQMELAEVLQPAIGYAENGFPLSEVIAYYWERNAEILKSYPHFAATYMPGGTAPKKGEIFKNPRLAYTLKKIAQGGRDSFYLGSVATSIAEAVQSQGGFLSVEDLADHESEWVEPISTNYRGYDVWELPPNGQGTAVLQMLNILEGFDIAEMGYGSAEYIHHLVEAKKLAFEDRAKYYADPDFYNIPIQELISKEYATERRALIDSDRAARSYPAGELEQGNTIYLTTADSEGNMVSLIQSNYRGMGSALYLKVLGLCCRIEVNFLVLKKAM